MKSFSDAERWPEPDERAPVWRKSHFPPAFTVDQSPVTGLMTTRRKPHLAFASRFRAGCVAFHIPQEFMGGDEAVSVEIIFLEFVKRFPTLAPLGKGNLTILVRVEFLKPRRHPIREIDVGGSRTEAHCESACADRIATQARCDDA